MDIIEETEKALATLHPKEREERIRDLDWPFEEGRLFTAGGFKKEDVGKAAFLILSASFEEKDEHVKDEMFSVLKTAVDWNDISEFMNWDVVVEQLPHLSLNSLIDALNMLGSSKRISNVDVLRQYLDYNQQFVQETAFDAICQIWWDASGHDPQVKALMHIKEHFQSARDEVMSNLDAWLEQKR